MAVDVVVAMVTGPAVAGRLPVRLAGGETRSLVCDRQVAATAAAGDQVLIMLMSGTGWVTALLSTTPGTTSSSTAEPPPTPPEQITTWVGDPIPVAPTWTGTWRGGRWLTDRNDLGQGDYGYGLNQGAAFYGRGLRSLRLLTGTTVRIRREDGGVFGAQAPTMRLLAGSSLGATYPAVLTTAPGPSLRVGGATDWTIPAGWLARLGAGGDAGGIGIGTTNRTPYIWIDGPSMVVAARYERTTT